MEQDFKLTSEELCVSETLFNMLKLKQHFSALLTVGSLVLQRRGRHIQLGSRLCLGRGGA